jgi:hypothetical protein
MEMTSATTYTADTPDPTGDWFHSIIAPETVTVERTVRNNRMGGCLALASVLATGIGVQSDDPRMKDVDLANGSSTVLLVPIEYTPPRGISENLTIPDPVHQLSTIQTRLGLTKVGLANACLVKRQTIYDWYKEKFPPMGDNARRLNTLFRIADTAARRGFPTLNPRFSGRPISTGQTLPELLAAKILDQDEITRAIEELAQLETSRQHRSARSIRERLGWKEPSEEQQTANLDHNLRHRRQG